MRALTGRRLKVGKRPGTTRWEKSIDLGAVLFVDTPGFGHMAGQGRKAIERAKTALVQKLESWSSRLVLTVLIIDISLFRELVERWEEFKEILNNDKMETVFEMLDKVNPPTQKKQKGSLEDDIIDI
jgi:GTP-binding protein EngB required for normal cell division